MQAQRVCAIYKKLEIQFHREGCVSTIPALGRLRQGGLVLKNKKEREREMECGGPLLLASYGSKDKVSGGRGDMHSSLGPSGNPVSVTLSVTIVCVCVCAQRESVPVNACVCRCACVVGGQR